MKKLPSPRTYEKEFIYFPWRILIKKILKIIKKIPRENSEILDLMCGPGYLLGEINKIRPDLHLEGIDMDEKFISHAKEKYPLIKFSVGDVLEFKTNKQYDLILCTGGIHHLPYEKQEEFIEKISKLLKPRGFCILADPYIKDFSDEQERKKAAAKLGYEYIISTIDNQASDDIIKIAIDILYNDVMGFEYKTSLKKLKLIYNKYFSDIEIYKTWPDKESEYGDYCIVAYN